MGVGTWPCWDMAVLAERGYRNPSDCQHRVAHLYAQWSYKPALSPFRAVIYQLGWVGHNYTALTSTGTLYSEHRWLVLPTMGLRTLLMFSHNMYGCPPQRLIVTDCHHDILF